MCFFAPCSWWSKYCSSIYKTIWPDIDGRPPRVRLLSDILGLSALVDAISYPSVPGATESSVLVPFHDEEAHSFQYGESIASAGTPGEPTIMQIYVKDTDGDPVSNALIDVWETTVIACTILSMKCRKVRIRTVVGRLRSMTMFQKKSSCVKLVAYPVSNDGPVAKLLRTSKRYWCRPAHIVSILPLCWLFIFLLLMWGA